MDALARTPRSQLSQEDRQAIDREAVLDVISNKSDPDKLKNLTPKKGQPFKPPAATRISQGDVEDAIRARSGANTPASANRSIKQFTPSKSGLNRELKEMMKSEEEAIDRQTDTERQRAEKMMEAKTGGKEIRMIIEPEYENCERLGCLKEVNAPDAILFEELGWDRDPGVSKEKHYRKFVAKELEHSEEIMSKPSEFNCYDVKRGQSRGAKPSMFSFGSSKKDSSGEEDTTTKTRHHEQ